MSISVRLALPIIAEAVAVLAIAAGCKGSTTGNPAQPAAGGRGKICVAWTIQSSQSVYGFTIYRGPSAEGPWTRVNPVPILAEEGGTTSSPHDYRYVDDSTSIVLGQTYWYWLEAVNSDGSKERLKWPPETVVAQVGINQEFPPPDKK